MTIDEQIAEGDQTLADRVVAHLTHAIISGELRPGSHISEPKLAKQLGVSRGPLREATRRLQERMLVTHTPRQGVRVIELTPETVREVCTIREALEGIAAREAARNITPEEADELTALIDRHRRLLESTDNLDYGPANADQDFHVAIVKYSRNELLFNMLTREYYPLLRLFRVRHRWIHGRALRALKEHQRIVDAILDRDADLAELLMRRHVSAAKANMEKVLAAGSDNLSEE
jgi:DNA-binding GntR family transcriptional regulator